MDSRERREVHVAWENMWDKFCSDMIHEYEGDLIKGNYLERADDEDEVMHDVAQPTSRWGQSSSTAAL